ncbi:MAG: acetate--CoA ligase family protein [Candidatus Aenigmatarchaeota archaeon]
MILKEIFQRARHEKRWNLTEDEARQVLSEYGIPVVKSKVVKNLDEAVLAAKELGFPLALKVISPDIIHKTDVGGVILNISDKENLEKSFFKMLSNLKKKTPKARIKGFLVQEMVESGQEVIIGGKKDKQFDQVVMFGLGGIFVEVFDDVSFRVVPIEKKDAEEMIEDIKGYKILKGFRGREYSIDSIVDILLQTSKLLEENSEIVGLDLNPVLVWEDGAVAVDARIIFE